MKSEIQITDCPRDAIQGIKRMIPAEVKAEYIQEALDSGLFHSVDFGSFVSHKAVPQMSDTEQVLKRLQKPNGKTQLLAIIANERGAEQASQFEKIDILGFPFSVSEEFQLRNTGASREEAVQRISAIQEIAKKGGQKVRVYMSMAFGNPYKEIWNVEEVVFWANQLTKLGIDSMALSDTVGVADVKSISELFLQLNSKFPKTEWSAHLHAAPGKWREKVFAAHKVGCEHFDGAFLGYGGCPMAKDELVGNIPTEELLQWRGEEYDKIAKLKTAFQKMIAHA